MTERVTTLLNGLRVVTIRMPHTKTASVGVFVRTGSRNESKKLNGISHFLEHMAFKGTTTRSVNDIAIGVERLGAMMNAYTSKDTTAYYMAGLAEHAPIFTEMLADMMQNNIFPQDELDRERGVIIQEFNRSQDSPAHLVYDFTNEAAWGKVSGMGQTTLGPKKNISSFQREDFIDYMRGQYRAGSMIVGVAGNIDHDDAVRCVEQWFGDVPSGNAHEAKSPTYQGGVKIKNKAAFTQSNVEIAFPVSNLLENFYSDLMADSVLGGGMSSPLFTEIREKRGLVYSVHSYTDLMDDCGLLRIGAGTTPEHLPEFFNATCDLLKTLAEKVERVDMERAINQLIVEQVKGLERPFSRMEAAIEDLFTYGELKPTEDFIANLQEVKVADVQESFKRLLKTTPTLSMAGRGADEKYWDQVCTRLR